MYIEGTFIVIQDITLCMFMVNIVNDAQKKVMSCITQFGLAVCSTDTARKQNK